MNEGEDVMAQDAVGRGNGVSDTSDTNGANGPRRWVQFFQRRLGYAPSPMSKRTEDLHSRIRDADVSVSVCPYCGVGCSQLVYHKDGRVIDIEGNPESPISAGHLCPKGADTFQLINNPNRPTKVLYRAPRSDHWEERPLEWAMDRIAERVKATRDAAFQLRDDKGVRVNRTEAIGHIGGATLDNEENYLILKLWRALGIVHITNQARI
jgi:formate dehydrogenase major subunit